MAIDGNIGKKKASLLNMITMGLYQLITVILGFIIPKLLLDTYGAEIHGYTSTVTNIMSYIMLLNAGLATAGIQSLYAPLAKRDNKRLSEIINAVDKFYIKTGTLYTIAVVGCAIVLPFIIKSEIPVWEIAALMIIMGSTSTLECFIYSKHRVLLQASQHLFIVNLSDSFAIIIRGILQVVFIKLGFSIVVVQAVPVLMVLLRMAVLSVYVKKNFPLLDKKAKPDFSALSKRWSAFMHQIAGLVVNNTDVLILTLFTNLTFVSIYAVYNLVFTHLYTLMTNIFSSGTVASFGVLIHEERRETLLKSFSLYEFIYYFVITIIYSVSACMILPFVHVYTEGVSNIPYVDIKLAVLFVFIGIINNLRVPCNTIINAAGHFKETQWRAILEAAINLVVSLILVNPLGIYGILLGTVCSFAYRVTDIICYSNTHILGRSPLKSLLRIVRVGVIIIINIVIYNFIFDWKKITSFKLWFAEAFVFGVISFVTSVCINFIFEKNEMSEVIKIISSKMSPKNK